MSHSVIGIFDSTRDAQNAIQQLVSNGFTRERVDLSDCSRADYSEKDRDTDGITQFFNNLFGSNDDARNHSDVARKGCVVTVHTQSMQESELAADILDQYGAVDVNDRAMQYRNETSGGAATTATAEGTAIPVIEEELQIGKRVVETGGVRLRSRIIERPIEENLRLREEHINIERNPVNRAATEADLANFKEGTAEFTEHAEIPVVNKEARVVEEVKVNKEVNERNKTIRDTVRRTDVEADRLKSRDRERERDLDRDGSDNI
jgi:uncharacterized protein (TIGR02271 family)